MVKSKAKLIFAFIFLIGFAGFIYSQSNTPYEKQDMKPMLKEHLKLSADSFPKASFSYDGEKVSTIQPYNFIEFVLRKLGHVLEYAGLTLIVYFLLTQFILPTKWMCLFCLLFPLAYAVTDEWHQTYVPGRTGHLIDVFTFDLGGILIVLIGLGVFRLTKHVKTLSM